MIPVYCGRKLVGWYEGTLKGWPDEAASGYRFERDLPSEMTKPSFAPISPRAALVEAVTLFLESRAVGLRVADKDALVGVANYLTDAEAGARARSAGR